MVTAVLCVCRLVVGEKRAQEIGIFSLLKPFQIFRSAMYLNIC